MKIFHLNIIKMLSFGSFECDKRQCKEVNLSNTRVMLLIFGSMEKEFFLVLILICHSHQRPQLDVDVLTTTDTIDTTTKETKDLEKIPQVTEATAVSVQTSINVSSYGPKQIFEDFKPSNYYRPDGNPIFERPSPQVTYEVFYEPQHLRRPNNYLPYQLPTKPEDKNIVFPQATRENYSKHAKHNGSSIEPESRGPHKFNEVLPQFKPMKHDSGEVIPNFSTHDSNFYERHFGQYYGNEMSHYPNIIHEPPKSYHSVTMRKKKDPWRSVLSVLATILPVGLLLASFPPTVIKVNSTQYPYQFQKNSTVYNPNIVTGRYKSLRNNNTGRKINDEDEVPSYIDDCLKKKICENIKTNYSSSELDSLLQNNKLNSTDKSQMVEIAEAAVSTSPESCQVFVCSN